MIQWLVIATSPPMQIHGREALDYLDATLDRLQILTGVGNLRSDVDAEVPNVAIALANAAGESTAAFRNPPIDATATVYARVGSATVVQFEGVVQNIALSDDGASVELRA